VRSVRAYCLHWILTWNCRHLERVLSAYRPLHRPRLHQSIGLEFPLGPGKLPLPIGLIERRDVLSGLFHEYYRAA
jgi:hypothetical protein